MTKIQLQPYTCEVTLLPTIADLTNFFIQLADLPSLLLIEAARIGGEAAKKLLETAQGIIDILKTVADIIETICADITSPIFNGLRIPEIEWKLRIKSLVQSFHAFIMKTILEIIDTILPVNFQITVLGIVIDILDFFANPAEAFKAIAAQISAQIDAFFNLLPDLDKFFAGIENGIHSIELKVRAVLDFIMRKINEGLLGILHSILGTLISTFQSIWNALGLPALIALLTFDIDAIVQAVIDAAGGVLADAVEALYSISLAGISLIDIIGGKIEGSLQSAEEKLRVIVAAMRDFAVNYPKKLILEWMNIVTAFLNAIGLGALLQWLTFTFCDFLTLFGFPFNLQIDNPLVEATPS